MTSPPIKIEKDLLGDRRVELNFPLEKHMSFLERRTTWQEKEKLIQIC